MKKRINNCHAKRNKIKDNLFSRNLKVCSTCKKTLTLDNFGVCRSERDGMQGVCKSCRHETYIRLCGCRFARWGSWEFKRKKSESQKGERGSGWRGGISPINEIERKSYRYREWRTAVYMRDRYTCQMCHKIGGRLIGHHKKPFALYPELRYSVDNGITYCRGCHNVIHKIEGKKKTKNKQGNLGINKPRRFDSQQALPQI